MLENTDINGTQTRFCQEETVQLTRDKILPINMLFVPECCLMLFLSRSPAESGLILDSRLSCQYWELLHVTRPCFLLIKQRMMPARQCAWIEKISSDIEGQMGLLSGEQRISTDQALPSKAEVQQLDWNNQQDFCGHSQAFNYVALWSSWFKCPSTLNICCRQFAEHTFSFHIWKLGRRVCGINCSTVNSKGNLSEHNGS